MEKLSLVELIQGDFLINFNEKRIPPARFSDFETEKFSIWLEDTGVYITIADFNTKFAHLKFKLMGSQPTLSKPDTFFASWERVSHYERWKRMGRGIYFAGSKRRWGNKEGKQRILRSFTLAREIESHIVRGGGDYFVPSKEKAMFNRLGGIGEESGIVYVLKANQSKRIYYLPLIESRELSSVFEDDNSFFLTVRKLLDNSCKNVENGEM